MGKIILPYPVLHTIENTANHQQNTVDKIFNFGQNSPMKSPSNEDKIKMASTLIAILNGWGVSNADKITLLALPAGTKPRAIQRYQQDTPLPDDKDVQERVGHLLGIAEALRLAYPRNAQGGELWLNRPCKHFNGRIPMTMMTEEGLTGITAVRMYIDCSYDWFIDEQTSQPSRPK